AAAPPPARVLDLEEARFAERGAMTEKLAAACRGRGIEPPSTRGERVRLVLESLAAGYARALRQLERLSGERVEVLHLVGGAARNELLCRLTAQACGRRVLAGPVEATALGNL